MGKTAYLIIGALLGAAAGAAVNYLFGPATGTTFDSNYRSRWDAALEAGERAADERELELRTRFVEAKRAKPSRPDMLPPETPPPSNPDSSDSYR